MTIDEKISLLCGSQSPSNKVLRWAHSFLSSPSGNGRVELLRTEIFVVVVVFGHLSPFCYVFFGSFSCIFFSYIFFRSFCWVPWGSFAKCGYLLRIHQVLG